MSSVLFFFQDVRAPEARLIVHSLGPPETFRDDLVFSIDTGVSVFEAGLVSAAVALRGTWMRATSKPAFSQVVSSFRAKESSSKVSLSALTGRSEIFSSAVLVGCTPPGISNGPLVLSPFSLTVDHLPTRWSKVVQSYLLMMVMVSPADTSCTGSSAFLYSIKPLLGVWSESSMPSMTKLPSFGLSPKSPP